LIGGLARRRTLRLRASRAPRGGRNLVPLARTIGAVAALNNQEAALPVAQLIERDGMAFLLANARRAHPRRDHKTGRLRARLVVVGERT
jgi:hypothetical protein